MTDERTVQAEMSEGHTEAQRRTARATLGDRVPTSVETAEGTTGKRKRTTGEKIFDATTYGGFALLGNEITATAIVKQAGKDNFVGNLYRRGEELTQKYGPKSSTYVQGRLNYINFAIIGGMLMVPFIKILEDNKGKLVRFADRIVHGSRADSDPNMSRAHEEMDNAPKQTWGSLWKGRALTVLTAYTVDSTIGWKNSVVSRAFEGTWLDRYRSFDHLGERGAEFLAPKIATISRIEQSRAHSWIQNGISLFTLSSALTAIFYASSKFFAKRHDTRREIYEEIHQHAPASQRDSDDTQTVKPAPAKDEAPVPTVNAIAHEARVAAHPELGREA